MNKETIGVYTIAAVVGLGVAYLQGILSGITAGLSTIGATVILWHLFDTIRDVVASHYEKKFAPKKADQNRSSSL